MGRTCWSSATTGRFCRRRRSPPPAGRHQSPCLAAAEVPRGGADQLGHLPRRDANRRHGHPHDAENRRRALHRPGPLDIQPDETAGELESRLAVLGAGLVRRAIDGLEAGRLEALPQDPALASKAPRLKKTDGLIDWRRPAGAIKNHIRAMEPWPKTYTFWRRPDGPPLRLIFGPRPRWSRRRRAPAAGRPARSWRPPAGGC